MPSIVRAFAPSKVNLALSVGAPDAEGMHGISSWMVTTRFCDDLTVKRLLPGTPSRYAIEWHETARRRTPIDWKLANDLMVRAHRMLEERLGHELPVQVHLQKRIPVGGGLGGGSSNAAAMLRALDALFELRLRPQFLEHLAERLGSDVPFLVRGGSAVAEGRGERIEMLEAQRIHLVLAFPDAQCPTGRVYREFDALRPDARIDAERVRALAASEARVESPFFNDLADAACVVAPGLAAARADLAELARQPVHVSGSGSSLFLVCDSAVHADVLADSIETKLGLPAIATVTAPPPIEEVDGEARAEATHSGDDD
jgi:4-diphosphocytidyl-2-C-methyl-D-erythritol kinase